MTQCETHTPRSYERKSTRIIATCKLTLDQLADFRPCRKSPQNRLKTKMLGGQAETIMRIWGFDRALITKDAAVL